MKKIFILILFIFSFFNILAQEQIQTFVNSTNQQKNFRNKSTDENILELPFFDDFSSSNFYVDSKKWIGSNVFVNQVYPIMPPSLGVATLDAIKNTGEFYSTAGYENNFSADTLSSLPLNLNFENDKTIYLSFYYQAQGKGDNPEKKDSLILEFYSPTDKNWQKTWSVEGSSLHDFKQVIINIADAKYLQKGFRFRFRNLASLSGNTAPSKVVNADHWHIDYIYLNRGRSASDTNPKDIAFVYPMQSFLKYYEAMPWKHFLVNTKSQLSNTTKVTYLNNDNKKRHIDTIYYEFTDNKGITERLNGGSYDVEANKSKVFNPPYTYGFLANAKDSTSFTIKARFVTDNYDRIINNELKYLQKFYDYYAYDDGTAEASYGLTGDGAQKARLAYKFNCAKKDTLKAIQMYFCRSLYNKSQRYFNLTIWNDNNGKPGEIIYQKEAVRPEYETELNKFHTYYINDKTIVLQGVFYVGWVQITANMLNLGLDFNRNNNKNIFFNIDGNWQNSKYEASLMIRPFFGRNLTLDTKTIQTIPFAHNIKVFPNPTSKFITISVNNEFNNQKRKVLIYNMTGKLVHKSDFINNANIELNNLKNGIYILQLTAKNKTDIYTQKIIISR